MLAWIYRKFCKIANGKIAHGDERGGFCILKKYTVVVCDFEEEYAIRLMNYINGQSIYGILTLAFTQIDRFKEYLDNHSFDLALIAKEIVQEFGNELGLEQMGEKVVHLCKEESEEGIYKYQPASEIIVELQKMLEKEYQIKQFETKEEQTECKMIGVYSPIGRSGKTNLALAMAKERGSLYIGMEEYSNLTEGRTTMSDFCYWIRKKEEMIIKKVEEQMIIEDEIWKLLSPLTYLDLKELTVDEYAWFFGQLKSSGKFRKIVVDIGCGSLCNYSFFALFHQIFVPILPEISSQKERHFKKVLQFVGLEKSSTRFEYIVVPRENFSHPDMTEFVRKLERK